jgi:phage-related minor tail protein
MASTDDEARAITDRQRQLESLDRLAQRFGQSLSGALTAGTSTGKQLDQVLGSIGTKLASALGTGAVASLQSGLMGAIQSLTSSLTLGSGAFPFAQGGVVAAGRVQPFAAGGIVGAPTYFPMAKGIGLMGEAGPEAVLPLARGPDGRLGVSGGGGAATQVTVHVQATDLASFKRSETQIAAALARAVARGRRAT